MTVCGRCGRIAIGAELDLVNHPGARLAGKIKTEHDPTLHELKREVAAEAVLDEAEGIEERLL